jgi:crotonobetainyl-CoA:carnitine CoA-transferase CaiB-like acyl-CoA transferase
MRALEVSSEEGAAAFAAKRFLQAGWQVIKAESPDRPPTVGSEGLAAPAAALDIFLNAGKERRTLDYRDDGERAEIDRLAQGCDVLLTDASAADVETYQLLELGGSASPRVRTSITPYGLSGPYRDYEATPSTLLAHAGHTWLMGDPGRPPLSLPGDYAARQAGTFAFIASMAAHLQSLAAPEQEPRTIEVSTMECLATLHQFTDTMWTFGQQTRSRHGSRWENLYPSGLFAAEDGWVGTIIQPDFWERFTHLIGHPEFAEGHAFADPEVRVASVEELGALIEQSFRSRSKREIFREGQETWRVTIGFVATLADLFEDPHLQERDFWTRVAGEPGVCEELLVPRLPYRYLAGDEDESSPSTPGPALDGEPGAAELAPPRRAYGARSTAQDHPRGATNRPLAGIRVLDLTRVWAGPLATRTLADLGADTIRIEAIPGSPAPAPRRPWSKGAAGKFQRNKRSLALDLKSEAGRELFLRLVSLSDVVVENFSARVMPGLRLGYERLREVNPGIVYVPMPAFGLSGPYRNYVGLGPAVEPMSGLTALFGYSDGEPRNTATALPDAIAGTTAAAAVVAALERRGRTGRGAYIDFSQHEASIDFIGEYFIERQLTGAEPHRAGNGHPVFAPNGIYPCAGEDEWIAIAVRNDREWSTFCSVAHPEWAREERFSSAELRRAHRAELDSAIASWTTPQEKGRLTAVLQGARLAAAPVARPKEWLADAHLATRGYFVDLVGRDTGPARWDGLPVLIDGDRSYGEWLPPPGAGEHSRPVLSELLGLSETDINQLIEKAVVFAGD